MAQPLIEFRDVGHAFDDGRIVALRGINTQFEKGESVAIVGPSGSGKTTLVQLICGIREPMHGEIRWQGKRVASPREWTGLRRSGIGIVFQEFNLLPTLTAAENIEMALLGGAHGKGERKRRVERALADVGLAKRAAHLPHELSGGERQRVAVARSIVNEPALLLADEPTGNLDSVNSAAIMKLLFELHRKKRMTLVVVTHDPSIAARCQRIIEIRDGSLKTPSKGAQKAAKRK